MQPRRHPHISETAMRFLSYGLSAPVADALDRYLAQGPHVAVFVDTLDDIDENLATTPVDALLLQGDDDEAVIAFVKCLRRAGHKLPILMIGKPSTATTVEWLGTVDDVIAEPADLRVIEARLIACARRSNGLANNVITIRNVEADITRGSVTVNGQPLHLTGKEKQLLQCLMTRAGSVMTKERLLDALYGRDDEPEMKIIDVFICKLRKKLEAAGAPYFVQTQWGRGYIVHKDGTIEQPTRSTMAQRKAFKAEQVSA